MVRLLDYPVGLMVGQQLRDATDVALMDQAAASGARMTLALGVLVAEIVAAAGRVGFESLRRLAKTLGRRPVGLQLGHETFSISIAKAHKAARATRSPAESTQGACAPFWRLTSFL